MGDSAKVGLRAEFGSVVVALTLLAGCSGTDSPNSLTDNEPQAVVAGETVDVMSPLHEFDASADADEAKQPLAEAMEDADDATDDVTASPSWHRHLNFRKLALVAGAIGAGNGILTGGYADRRGARARFDQLADIAVGPDGAIYVSEHSRQQSFPDGFTLIRRIDHSGRVTTYAGQRATPPCEPPCAEPPLSSGFGGLEAAGIAFDAAGNLYLAAGVNRSPDFWSLRKLAPDIRLTTLFGTFTPCGSSTQQDGVFGSSVAAGIVFPTHVQVAASGDIYLADDTSLKKISPSGVVTVIATVPNSSQVFFGGPGSFGFALDAAGNIYATLADSSVVHKYAPDGALLARFGAMFQPGSSDGTSDARFNRPTGVAVDTAGNAYIADTSNHTIRKLTPAGVVTTLAGQAGAAGRQDGIGQAARLNFPTALAFDPVRGRLVFLDFGPSTVRAVTLDGKVTTIAGSPLPQPGDDDGPALSARLNRPFGTDSDKWGNVYIGGGQRCTVRKLTRHANGSRTLTTIAGKPGDCIPKDGPIAEARFGPVVDVAIDFGGRVIYVADGGALRKIEHGMVTTLATFEAGPPPSSPAGLAVLPDHSVLASAPINSVIHRITPTGEKTVFAGVENNPGSADGPRLQAQFNAPTALAAARDGTVYVGDSVNNTLRKITRDGRVITVAGVVGQTGLRDGVGTAALLGLVGDIAIDAKGTVFFTQLSFDPPWSAIRALERDGSVKTLLGDGIYEGVALGAIRNAGVNLAYGIAVVGDALYATDLQENAVLKLRR